MIHWEAQLEETARLFNLPTSRSMTLPSSSTGQMTMLSRTKHRAVVKAFHWIQVIQMKTPSASQINSVIFKVRPRRIHYQLPHLHHREELYHKKGGTLLHRPKASRPKTMLTMGDRSSLRKGRMIPKTTSSHQLS